MTDLVYDEVSLSSDNQLEQWCRLLQITPSHDVDWQECELQNYNECEDPDGTLAISL